jgi:NDP-sugar pyrophosphorylase family protein
MLNLLPLWADTLRYLFVRDRRVNYTIQPWDIRLAMPIELMIAHGPEKDGVVALLMAGGSGERMRSSGAVTPKPLVSVLGMSLIERNVRALLRNGFREIVAAVPSGSVGNVIAETVERELKPICAAAGGQISVLVEDRPLGNIGAAALLGDRAEHVLVVFSDNLTGVDLRSVVLEHHTKQCSMTLVVHHEASRLPYGRVTLSEGFVTAYEEKPEARTLISSGITVLGPDAMRLVPPNVPTGMVDLFDLVHRSGLEVAGYLHSAPWIDVNDTNSLQRAEDLIRSYPDSFALWSPDSKGVGNPTDPRRETP